MRIQKASEQVAKWGLTEKDLEQTMRQSSGFSAIRQNSKRRVGMSHLMPLVIDLEQTLIIRVEVQSRPHVECLLQQKNDKDEFVYVEMPPVDRCCEKTNCVCNMYLY